MSTDQTQKASVIDVKCQKYSNYLQSFFTHSLKKRKTLFLYFYSDLAFCEFCSLPAWNNILSSCSTLFLSSYSLIPKFRFIFWKLWGSESAETGVYSQPQLVWRCLCDQSKSFFVREQTNWPGALLPAIKYLLFCSHILMHLSLLNVLRVNTADS